MKFLHLLCFFSSAVAVLGGCLNDWNTGQPSSAWNTRLWSYSSSSAKSASTSATLTFTSFNLQSSISSSCKSDPKAQAAFMKTDYVGMQEVVQGVDTRCNCNLPKIIADETGHSTRFAMTFPWRTGQYGVALGTTQAILDTKYYLYNYNGAEQRALVAVQTKPAGLNGRSLWFISTHLDYTVWAARQAQTAQLIQWVKDNIVNKDSSASVVAVGDFNGGPGDSMYPTMKTFFKNAWEVYTGSSAGGNTYPASWPGNRFDHIWYYTPSNVQVQLTSVEVIDTTVSDHRPLKATIKFTTPSTPAPATPAPVTPAPTPAATKAPATPAPTPAATKAPATPAPTPAATKAPATPAPATPAPTPAATKAPVTSAPATSAPPQGSTSAPASGCAVSISFNPTGNNIEIKNVGNRAVKALELSFSPSLPSNNWNLNRVSSNTYSLPDWAYQSLSNAGSTYSSSGFWTADARPTITATRVSC